MTNKEILIKQKHLTTANLHKVLSIHGIENLEQLKMPDCDLHASDLIAWAVDRICTLEQEAERLGNSLEYIYERGYVTDRDGIEKIRYGLGLDYQPVDNRKENISE